MSDEPVLLQIDAEVAQITINRPRALNALNSAVLDGLSSVVRGISEDHSVRAVVVTGAGEKAFVAGADISEMSGYDAEQGARFAAQGHAAFAALEALPMPVIAAVNGFALGGGCELALACDFIYASEKARFGQPEVNLGVLPGFGGTQRLSRRVGVGVARELIYSAAMVKADEALRMGLVNRVCAPEALLGETRATAALIASKGPVAVAHAKRVIREGVDLPLAEGNEMEIEAFGRCFETEDQREGMQAFLEKREAHFQGK